jgi:hypothetical protein
MLRHAFKVLRKRGKAIEPWRSNNCTGDAAKKFSLGGGDDSLFLWTGCMFVYNKKAGILIRPL